MGWTVLAFLLNSVLWGRISSLDVEQVLALLPASTVEVRLKGKGLTGTIPPDIPLRFPNLTVLDFRSNELSGTIPAGLERATGLVKLYLGRNQLVGPIPLGLVDLPNLRKIDLSWNLLSGPIPKKAGSWWPKVEEIHYTNNRLQGEIPAELGNLHRLEELRLDLNELTGSIPRELGALSNLEELDLKENKLTGAIPAELGNLSTATLFALSDNQLTGKIPAALGKLRSVDILFLNGNKLSGSIPAELGNLTQVRYVHLQGNELTGTIPAELGSLSNVIDLRLSANQLSGSLPAAVGGWKGVMWLYLDNNHLSGELPEEVGDWRMVHKLYLQNNRLTGRLPGSVGNWLILGGVHLGSNAFSGQIPDEVRRWTAVQSVNLSDNLFDGPVPKAIGNWTKAQQINLDFNRLTSLPDEMNLLESLEIFTMQSNRLQGTLLDLGGPGKLSVLNLQGNAIEALGILPRRLQVLDLSSNKLTELPEPLDGLQELQSLTLTDNLISKWPARGVYAEVSAAWLEVSVGYGRPFPWTNLQRLEVSGNPIVELSGMRRDDKITVVGAFLSSLAYLENLRFIACRRCNMTGALSPQSLPGLVDARACPGGAYLCIAGTPRPGMPNLQTLDLSENEISKITALPSRSLMKIDLSRNALEKLDQSWFNVQGQNTVMELKVRDNLQLRASVQDPKGPCSGEETELLADPTAYVSQGEGYECTKLCRSRWATYSIDSDLDESSLCRCKAGYGGSGRNCTPCQQDTYSVKEDAFGLIRTCQACPPGSDTDGVTRATSISACKCPAGVFLNASANACVSCPQSPFRATKKRGEEHVAACTCSSDYIGIKEFDGVCGCDDGFYMNHALRTCKRCSNSEMCWWGVHLDRSLQPPKVNAGYWPEPITDLENFTGNSIWRCAGAGSCSFGGICAEGRTGTACSLCLPGWRGGPDGPCVPCDTTLTSGERQRLLAVGTVLTVVPTVLFFHLGLAGVHGQAEGFGLLMQLRSVRGSLKQMVKHIQSVTVIGGMSVKWPPIAEGFFNMLASFTVNVPLISLTGCLNETPNVGFDMMVKWTMPPIFILLTIVAMPTSWALARVLRGIPCRAGSRVSQGLTGMADDITMSPADVCRVLLFSLTMFWSTLVANSYEALTCIPSPNGKLTIATYPHIQCDFSKPEFRTLALLSFLTILLYLILPCYALYRAFQKSAENMALSLSSERGWYGFLFEDFRDGRLLWLIGIMVKDALFVLVPAALPGQGSFQLLLVAVLTAGHGLLVTHSSPFHNRSNTLLEAWNAGSAAVLCIYSVGMGYQATAGMEDVEELFEDGAADPAYVGRAIGMVVVQVVTIAVPSAVLVYQLLCAIEKTRRLLPKKVQPMSPEEAGEWLDTFLKETDGGRLEKILRKFDESDLHAFRALMEETSATMGECLSSHSSSLVRMANKKMKSKNLDEEAHGPLVEEANPDGNCETVEDGAQEHKEEEHKEEERARELEEGCVGTKDLGSVAKDDVGSILTAEEKGCVSTEMTLEASGEVRPVKRMVVGL